MHAYIRVDKEKHIARRFPGPVIASMSRTTALRSANYFRAPALCYAGGIVGRSIVNHNTFIGRYR